MHFDWSAPDGSRRCIWAKLVRRQGVPFPRGLGTCEGGFVLSRSLDMLCQEIHEVWYLGCRCQGSQLSQQAKAFLSPWTGCDRKQRAVVRDIKEKEGV